MLFRSKYGRYVPDSVDALMVKELEVTILRDEENSHFWSNRYIGTKANIDLNKQRPSKDMRGGLLWDTIMGGWIANYACKFTSVEIGRAHV